MRCTCLLMGFAMCLLGAGVAWGDGTPGNLIPDVTYSPADGKVHFDADGLDVIAFTIVSPDPVDQHFEFNLDPAGAPFAYWGYEYVPNAGDGSAQFWDGTITLQSGPLGIVTDGPHHIMTLPQDLTDADFGTVTYGHHEPSGDANTGVTVLPEPGLMSLLGIGAMTLMRRRKRR